MLLPFDDNIIKKGFCCGVDEVSVDSGHRIRLTKSITKILTKHKVHKLWEYPDPSGPRMILCPPQHRSTYIELVTSNLPDSMDAEIADRKFIFAGQPVSFDAQGRILIIPVCRRYLKVKATDVVVIIGVGWWYEVWREKDWAAGSGNNGT